MKGKYFSIKYRYSDILLKTLNLEPFVLLQSYSFVCWNGFYDSSITLCNDSVSDVHPRCDSTELAEAVSIETNPWYYGHGTLGKRHYNTDKHRQTPKTPKSKHTIKAKHHIH